MNKVSRRTPTSEGWKIEVQVYDDDSASDTKQDLQLGINFYHEETMVTTVTWTSLTLGTANQTADSPYYTYTVTANAPFKIQIKSLDSQLIGQTFGQTPIDISYVTIDKDDVLTACVILHLSTSWQDFDTNAVGYDKTNNSYWFLSLPSVV